MTTNEDPVDGRAPSHSGERTALRPVREITAEMENFRTVPFVGTNMFTSKRDPVEPEPVGTYVVMVFQVTGYDPDCDGSLMARLRAVQSDGESTGWEPNCLGLYPDTALVVEHPSVLWDLARTDRTPSDG